MSDGPRIRVAALIEVDGCVVTVRHRAGNARYHLLPGGGVGYRETLAEALVREVREETGLEVCVGELLFLSDTIDPSGPRHVVNVTLRCTVTGGAITDHPQDPRVESVDLVSVDELAGLDLRPPIASEVALVVRGESSDRAQYLGSLFSVGE